MTHRSMLLLAFAGASLFADAAPLLAQAQRECTWEAAVMQGFTVGDLTVYRGQRVTLRCTDGSFVQADSATINEVNNFHDLYGNVLFRDPENQLRSERAIYRGVSGRLDAWDQVVLTDRVKGSVIRGDTLLLWQASEFRPEDEFQVTGRRPHATLYPEGQGEAPYEIDADRIFSRGESYFRATGTVEVDREDVQAFADSLEFNDARGHLFLADSAKIFGETYELTGDTITLLMPADQLEEAVALGRATLLSDSVDVRGDSIHLVMEEKEPKEITAQYEATFAADSLSGSGHRLWVSLLDGRVERLVEVSEEWAGRPQPTPTPDSTAVTSEDDPSLGDSLTVTTGGTGPPVAPPTAEIGEELEEAEEDPSEAEEGPEGEEDPVPKLANLLSSDFSVEADSIEVQTRDGKIRNVYAIGNAYGEALRRTDLPVMDSLTTVPSDSGLVVPDTTSLDTTGTVIPPDSTVVQPPDSAQVAEGEEAASDSQADDELDQAALLEELFSKDWLRADTIIATFAAPGEVLEDLIAEVPTEEGEESTLEEGTEQAGEQVVEEIAEQVAQEVAEEEETIEAPAEASDIIPSEKVTLRRLVGFGNAQSLYRLAAEGEEDADSDGRLALNYVKGDRIIIYLVDGEVDRIEVEGQTLGLYLSPDGTVRETDEVNDGKSGNNSGESRNQMRKELRPAE